MSRVTASIALLTGVVALLGAAEPPEVERDIAYAGGGPGDPRRLDLYLPPAEARPAPLFAFVDSHFWRSAGDARQLDADLARPLRRDGVAVALIRHRLAPDHRHPAQAEDVAAAVAWLVRHAAERGIDPERIFLAGHSSGAHLAALVALDESLLAAHGLDPGVLEGVVAISGVYDLDPDEEPSEEEVSIYDEVFGGGRARRKASPIEHAHGDAPRFLVLAAQQDIPGYVAGGERFAEALRRQGHPDAEFYFILGRDHRSIVDIGRPGTGTGMHVLSFLGIRPLPPVLADLDAATRYWRNPRFSTEPFWSSGAKVRSYDADDRFRKMAGSIFMGLTHKREVFEAERFHAIQLDDYLEALGPERVGSGDWLTLTNVQNEKTYLKLEELLAWRPVIVIGIDDERNLFRMIDIHRAKREYSWRDDLPRPPYLARPMGAFLYLLDEPDTPLAPRIPSHFSLPPDGFALTEEDPLRPLRGLDPDVLSVFTLENGCVSCHSFRGVGARSGHLRARDAELHGGFALALEEYPPDVWKRFIFDQEEAAAMVGATPNPVREDAAQKVHDLVERERDGREAP